MDLLFQNWGLHLKYSSCGIILTKCNNDLHFRHSSTLMRTKQSPFSVKTTSAMPVDAQHKQSVRGSAGTLSGYLSRNFGIYKFLFLVKRQKK